MTNVGNGTDPLSIPPGSTLEMECKYRGVPSPFQTWYVNGEELAADDEALSSNGSGLAVREITGPPSGVYQCYVSSQHGTDISSSVLCAEGEYWECCTPRHCAVCWHVIELSSSCDHE